MKFGFDRPSSFGEEEPSSRSLKTVDDRWTEDDGWTMDHGYTISLPMSLKVS